MANVNDTYFDGYYKEIWRSLIPEDITNKETDFILKYFNLQPGQKVLDIMCGYGRHALQLGSKGVQVTAVDNLPDYILEISDAAKSQNIPVKGIVSNVLDFNSDEIFDLAICMGNSLNFFDAIDSSRLLSSVNTQLKEKGHLLINTWSLAEIVIKHFSERSWEQVGEMKHLSSAQYLFHPTRIESETTIITPNGVSEVKKAVDYIYSVSEMEKILSESGFSLLEIYSIPGRKKFRLGEPRAYIVAQKM
jgi:SAM-dependent methyltransferase